MDLPWTFLNGWMMLYNKGEIMTKLTRINASLKYGKYFTGKFLTFYYSAFIFELFIFILTIILIILAPFNFEIYDFLMPISVGCLIGLIGTLGMLYIILKNARLTKRIKEWLKDAVEIDAYCKYIDNFKVMGQPTQIKIQVEFKYNGKKIKKLSGDERYNEGNSSMNLINKYSTKTGYDWFFKKFADRQIKILYSPKYDQVLLLNDKKN